VKLSGWENRLIRYLRTIATASFRPGELDCALFFANCVREITGDDIAAKYRGKYRSLEKGYAALRKDGFDSHVDYVASLFERIPVSMAQRGDGVVLLDADGNEALGIVQGENVYILGMNGLGLCKLEKAVKAFRI